MPVNLIVLAAGQGTRMQSDLPKVMHEIGGAPLFAHALASGAALDRDRTVLVAGHDFATVEKAARKLDEEIVVVRQAEQLGTAHAVAQAADALAGVTGDAVVLYGDTPFIRPETLEAMAAARADGADVVVLGFEAADPGRYGRLVVEDGALTRIVEFKDATEAERAIRLCNSGVVMADAALLFDLVAAVGNDNAAGEYYLTDIVGIANARGLRAVAVTCDETETLGINTRAELAAAEAAFQARARAAAIEDGVTLVAPETVYFAQDTFIGRDAVIEPNVVFGPGVTVETGARIRAFSH
ncbi:MAG: NTP transferase domain-containing protein, partial [Maritimibacter sp.]|nr:NTP transferase domain-containing protein [Maritimibacter sp.]